MTADWPGSNSFLPAHFRGENMIAFAESETTVKCPDCSSDNPRMSTSANPLYGCSNSFHNRVNDHKHCTHLAGKRKKPLHGKYAPKGTMTAGVWICCFCGEYSDINGLPVDVSDILLDEVSK